MSKKGKQQRYVQLFHWILNSEAWKDLNAVERLQSRNNTR